MVPVLPPHPVQLATVSAPAVRFPPTATLSNCVVLEWYPGELPAESVTATAHGGDPQSEVVLYCFTTVAGQVQGFVLFPWYATVVPTFNVVSKALLTAMTGAVDPVPPSG